VCTCQNVVPFTHFLASVCMYILIYGLFVVSCYKLGIQFECMKPVWLFVIEYFTIKLQELQEQI